MWYGRGFMEALFQGMIFNIGHSSPWIIYTAFFLSAVLQITVPPYPGDTILIFGGYLGSTGIKAGNISILISYLLGTIVSSLILYGIGIMKGESVLKLKFISKYFTVESQGKAKKYLIRYGVVIFFICKFIPGLNSLIIILGGVLRYNPLWAFIGVGCASIVHNIAFFLVGRNIGYNSEGIKHFLSTYNAVVIASVIIGGIVYAVIKSYKSGKLFRKS
jgi:membrane protein DedA with SNARE-associated domain